MEDSATLISSVPEAAALRETQVDEYYSDISPEVFRAALKTLYKNPYPGLRPFKTSESVVFFGREGISDELLTRMLQCRFLAVLGASGTGKSSVIRAGLLPALEPLPQQPEGWKVAICRPGKNLFGNLARAIFAAKITPLKTELEIWQIISGSSYGYEKLTTAIDNSRVNTLIIIDQFEEIFRYRNNYGVSGRNDAALFVKMLIETSQNKALNTYVIITMRSEYLGDCIQLPQLVDAINNGQYLVPRLKSKQLADAIEEPTLFSGARTEDGYAAQLTGEIGDSMDQLPVLQHVLMRAYEWAAARAAGGKVLVRYQDYVQVGSMESALDQHAGEVYAGLTPKQQEYCRLLFQAITDKATDGRGIRRPLSYSTILQICREHEAGTQPESQVRSNLDTVINSFRKDNINFLMPPPHVPLADDLEIDISHESLMRIWNRLQVWIEEEAKDAGLLDELLQRGKNEYLSGGKLVIFREWKKKKRPGVTWASLYRPAGTPPDQFALKYNEAVNLIERSRLRQKAWIISIAIITTMIISSLAAAFIINTKYAASQTINKRLIAANNIIKAKNDSLNVTNRDLKAANQKVDLQNTELKKAYDTINDQNLVLAKQRNALTAQRDSLARQREELIKKADELGIENNKKETALTALKLTRDSLKTVSDSATNLKNLALAIRHSEKSLSIPVNDLKRENIKAHLALLAYQLYLESGSREDVRLLPQVYSALYAALKNKAGSKAAIPDYWSMTNYREESDHLASAAIANPAGSRPFIYLTAGDKKLYAFDLQNKSMPAPADKQTGNKLIGIEAGTTGWMAVNTLSKNLLMVHQDARFPDTVLSFPGIVRTAKFSLDGSLLYVYTADGTFTTVHMAERKKYSQQIPFRLEDIAVSQSHVYGLTNRGDVIKWTTTGTLLSGPVTISPPNKDPYARGTAISCKPDDGIIIWGNELGQVFYKKENEDKAQYLAKFGGFVTSIAFNDLYNLAAVASFDKTIQVFNLPHLQSDVPLVLTNNAGSVTGVFFQKDGQGRETLVTVISPGSIRIYPMDLQVLACRLSELYKERQPLNEELDIYIDKAVKNKKVAVRCE